MKSSSPWLYGSLQVWPEEGRLIFDGVAHKPGSRAFKLLLLLIENRERVVSKGEIFREVWPNLVVEENNLTVQISTLRKIFGREVIATYSGLGYRFVLDTKPSGAPGNQSWSLPKMPQKPAIAVMSFLCLSDDLKHETFAIFLAEEITSELSRFRTLSVVSRKTAATYKGLNIDSRTVAGELGVRYLLEGSVQVYAGKSRITIQLIDASTGVNIWNERFDVTTEASETHTDEITASIGFAVCQAIELNEFHTLRSATSGWGAYDLAVDANRIANYALSRSDLLLLNRALQRANDSLTVDKGCFTGLMAKVFIIWQILFFSLQSNRDELVEEATAVLEILEAIESNHPMVHTYRGIILQEAGQSDAALEAMRRALQLHPKNVRVLGAIACQELFVDLLEESIEHLLMVKRISPLDPWSWSHNAMLGYAYYGLHDFVKALYYAKLGANQAPKMVTPKLTMVTSYFRLGDSLNAIEVMKQALFVGENYVIKCLKPLSTGKAVGKTERSRIEAILSVLFQIDRDMLSKTMQQTLCHLETTKALDNLKLPQ